MNCFKFYKWLVIFTVFASGSEILKGSEQLHNNLYEEVVGENRVRYLVHGDELINTLDGLPKFSKVKNSLSFRSGGSRIEICPLEAGKVNIEKEFFLWDKVFTMDFRYSGEIISKTKNKPSIANHIGGLEISEDGFNASLIVTKSQNDIENQQSKLEHRLEDHHLSFQSSIKSISKYCINVKSEIDNREVFNHLINNFGLFFIKIEGSKSFSNEIRNLSLDSQFDLSYSMEEIKIGGLETEKNPLKRLTKHFIFPKIKTAISADIFKSWNLFPSLSFGLQLGSGLFSSEKDTLGKRYGIYLLSEAVYKFNNDIAILGSLGYDSTTKPMKDIIGYSDEKDRNVSHDLKKEKKLFLNLKSTFNVWRDQITFTPNITGEYLMDRIQFSDAIFLNGYSSGKCSCDSLITNNGEKAINIRIDLKMEASYKNLEMLSIRPVINTNPKNYDSKFKLELKSKINIRDYIIKVDLDCKGDYVVGNTGKDKSVVDGYGVVDLSVEKELFNDFEFEFKINNLFNNKSKIKSNTYLDDRRVSLTILFSI